jgi:hypothetical protein
MSAFSLLQRCISLRHCTVTEPLSDVISIRADDWMCDERERLRVRHGRRQRSGRFNEGHM